MLDLNCVVILLQHVPVESWK